MKARILAIVVGVMIVAAAGVFYAGGADAQPQPKRQRWEYATYIRSGVITSVNLPEKSFSDRDPAAVFRKLGGKGDDTSNAAFLRILGADGWELVSATEGDGPSFYLKRPAP